jgi:uncharacterized membrane protein
MNFIFYLAAEIFLIPGLVIGRILLKKRYPLVFYKFLGIVLITILTWFFATITGLNWRLIVILLLIGSVVVGAVALRFGRLDWRISKKAIKSYIFVSILSFILYTLINFSRTFRPDILGTEKLMDVALINALLKQDTLPIENPWLSGFYMNYYYLGQFLLSLIHFFSQVPVEIGYNLSISLVAVWIFQILYILYTKLTRSPVWSFIFSTVTLLGGNLFIIAEHFKGNKGAWFAGATRVIPFTINEFPSYSVLLGDLHGHYLSFPFFVFGIYFIYLLVFTKDLRRNLPGYATILGLLMGFLYLINSWDVLTLGFLLTVFIIYDLFAHRKQFLEIHVNKLFPKYTGLAIISLIPFILIFVLSRSSFVPPVNGIGINKVFSPIEGVFLLFGQFAILSFITFVVITALIKIKPSLMRYIKQNKVKFAALVLITSVIMMILLEFFYAKDIFTTLNPPYSRTNTVFKFYYHIWGLFCIGTFVFTATTHEMLNRVKRQYQLFYTSFVSFLLVIMFSYFVYSLMQFLGPKIDDKWLSRIFVANHLDGYKYIDITKSEDREIINYLKQRPFSRILEYVTYESYSYYGRFSAYTGHATVQGWPLHNVQWYNGYDGSGIQVFDKRLVKTEPAQRITDIASMYTSQDPNTVQELLNKYQTEYVIFGSSEIEFLKKTNKSKGMYYPYSEICTTIWSKNESRIFKCEQHK